MLKRNVLDQWPIPLFEVVHNAHDVLGFGGKTGDGLVIDHRSAGSFVDNPWIEGWAMAAFTSVSAQQSQTC